MRNWSALIFGTLIAVGALALILVGSRSAAASATAAPPAATQAISMTSSLTFAPTTVTIIPGTTVTWTNAATFNHTTTSDTTGIWDSGTVNAGKTFSFTFNTVGTFGYFCKFHGASDGTGMAGTIIVVAPTATPTPSETLTATTTNTVTATPTVTLTSTITTSPTETITPSGSETVTSTPSVTSTDTPTSMPTSTETPSKTATQTIATSGAHTIDIPLVFNNTVSRPTPAPTSVPTPTTVPAVSLVNYAFQPTPLQIQIGTTVVWTNTTTSTAHTVTADNSSFDSGNLDAGKTFSFTFNTPGTFAYYCQYHGGPGGSGMSGNIVVNPGP